MLCLISLIKNNVILNAMKKILLFTVLVLSATLAWSQNDSKPSTGEKPKEDRNFRIPLIGESAPSFTAESTNGELNFPDDFGRNWKILFSHPQDFTPVCTSEILELANLQTEFNKLGVKLVVVSTDPIDTHVQWKKAMEGLSYKEREPVKIKFPLVDDENLIIAKEYGMIHASSNTTRAVRGVFIIDPDNIVQAIYFYPMSVGRSTDELVRMVTALQTTSAEKVMTPANWKAGNDLLIPIPPEMDPKNPTVVPEGYYNLAWFMWYKKTK
jgi:peroxiredoxin (alkyl hydroperoxide reductase subunit C)